MQIQAPISWLKNRLRFNPHSLSVSRFLNANAGPLLVSLSLNASPGTDGCVNCRCSLVAMFDQCLDRRAKVDQRLVVMLDLTWRK